MAGSPSVARLDVEPSSWVRPYTPHWYDHLVRWVDRLPGPYWLFYLGLGLILSLIETLIQWLDGTYPVGTLNLFHLVWCFVTPYLLGFGHFLYHTAMNALEDFQPVVNASQEEFNFLRYQLTNMPLVPGLLANLVGLAFATLAALSAPMPLPQILNVSSSTLSLAFNYLVWYALGCVSLSGTYFILRQQKLVNQIYTHHTTINLFRLIPLYGFARLGASTAVGVSIFAYGYYASGSIGLQTTLPGLVTLLLSIPVVVVAFILPLLGIHRLLVKEKQRLLARNAERMEAAIAELHQQIDKKEITGIDALHKAIESLEREQKILQRISTWPWSPETLRGVLAAVFLPVAVWAIQQALQRLMGP
jgi:hypothetical protein